MLPIPNKLFSQVSNSSYRVYGCLDRSTTTVKRVVCMDVQSARSAAAVTECTGVQTGQQQQLNVVCVWMFSQVSNSSYSEYGGLEWSTTLTVCTVVQPGPKEHLNLECGWMSGQQQQLRCVRWFRQVSNSGYSVYGGLDRSTRTFKLRVCVDVQSGQQQRLQCVRLFSQANNTTVKHSCVHLTVTTCTLVQLSQDNSIVCALVY